MVLRLSEQKQKLPFSVCFHHLLSLSYVNCASLFLSIRSPDLKKPMHLPTHSPSPSKKSGQKCLKWTEERLKHIRPTDKTRCKQGQSWSAVQYVQDFLWWHFSIDPEYFVNGTFFLSPLNSATFYVVFFFRL